MRKVNSADWKHSFLNRSGGNLCFAYSIYVIMYAIIAASKPNDTEKSSESENALVIVALLIAMSFKY